MPLNERLRGLALRAASGVREAVPEMLMIGGAASISYGAWLLHPSAGYGLAGCFSLTAGWLLARGGRA